MSRLKRLITAGLLLGLSTSVQVAAVTHTFTVNVPRKVSPDQIPSPGGPCQISTVRLTVSFATDPGVSISGIAIRITEPDLQSNGSPPETWPAINLPAQALTPGMALVTHKFQTPPPFGGGTVCPPAHCPTDGDRVNISAPDPAGYDATHYQRYEIDILLLSNYKDLDKGTQANTTDTYTIAADVTTTPAMSPVTISGVCLESYDPLNRSAVNASCAPPSSYFVPITDPAQAQLLIDNNAQPLRQCFKERSGADAFLVLDKSGSMASSTLGGSPRPKIQALQETVKDFDSVWHDLRSTEAAANPPVTNPDNIGFSLFDSSVIPWTDGGLAAGMNTFAAADPLVVSNLGAGCTATSCGQLVPGTATSIGGGLLSVVNSFPADPPNRHVVLLMSDGMQNTDPMVEVDPNNANRVGTYCAPGNTDPRCTVSNVACTLAAPCDLPTGIPTYAVTVGTGLAVSAAVNQGIATATGGFYINTEDNSDQLKPFFLEMLQNVLKFNSYETVRMISQTGPQPTLPFTTTMPLSTTSHDVEFSLMWARDLGALRLTVTPPGVGAQPIVKESASGYLSVVQQLPMPSPFDPSGDWTILVEAARTPVVAVRATTGQPVIPFQIYVMADDGAVKTDLSVVPADYRAGDNIRLRARLTQLGSPLLGLGSHASDKIWADLIKPGQSIGDMLSESQASQVPPATNPDLQPGVEAKLFNMLQATSSLNRVPDRVQLYDDGKPEHGDDVAGDGIYSALYPAPTPGHYNFLFSVESTDPNSVRFSRQQLRTAYVRAVPDAGNTVFQTSILRRGDGNVLSITMTPRVKPGPGCAQNNPRCGRMGPGWANYFWFTAAGVTPFKAVDKLNNGIYTATLPFTGTSPPQVSVHFEDVLAIIGDSVPPDQLPQALGPGNVLTLVPPPPFPTTGGGGTGHFALFLDAGANKMLGTLGTGVNAGFSFNAGLEVIAAPRFSVEGIFGYHHFPGKVTSAIDLYQFSANAKTYLWNGPVRPFVNGGPGGYRFSVGSASSTYFGGNVGGGVLFEINSRVGVQGSYNFHMVNTPVEVTKFHTFQGGIRFVF